MAPCLYRILKSSGTCKDGLAALVAYQAELTSTAADGSLVTGCLIKGALDTVFPRGIEILSQAANKLLQTADTLLPLPT